ncbi:MAG: PilT/PilU family type 4a pilus ATPase [Candidatus Omnitrophica bacterium]|nr:PilT/PilU family type 4a pilus ATPase [Candidatus Omnitrophota bacterium]
MSIKELLKIMVEKDASDIFLRAHGPVRLRLDGKVLPLEKFSLTLKDIEEMIDEITTSQQKQKLKENLEIDFSLFIAELEQRFRISIFTQRNSRAIVVRNIRKNIQTFEELNLPAKILINLCSESRGLILLTGSTGSGKSTTIASMIQYINDHYHKHILTVEEPIEFTFKDKNCIINQRELGLDVYSYAQALRGFALQSPDVIFIGNIRDYETMASAITAAETGTLVLSTLHTINATQTIERIINFFPPYQHEQIKIQLSYLLKGVISLRLVPFKDKPGRIPAYEIMLLTPTISRLIREGKIWEIPRYIEEGEIFGMQSFTQSLAKLVREGKISEEVAVEFADNKEELSLALKGIRYM